MILLHEVGVEGVVSNMKMQILEPWLQHCVIKIHYKITDFCSKHQIRTSMFMFNEHLIRGEQAVER